MSKVKKVLYSFVVVCVSCIIFLGVGVRNVEAFSPNWSGYTDSYVGANKVYSAGNYYFYLETDGKVSQVKLQFRYAGPSADLNAENLCWKWGKSTKWKVTIEYPDNGRFTVNNHNIHFSNGTDEMYVWTQVDSIGNMAILDIPISFDMPAHNKYVTYRVNCANINARMNTRYYNKDGTGANSALEQGYHSGSTSRRTIHHQVNTAHIGVRSMSNGHRYYGTTIAVENQRPSISVDVHQRVYVAWKNAWEDRNTYTVKLKDGDYIYPENRDVHGYKTATRYERWLAGVNKETKSVGQGSMVCNSDSGLKYYRVVHDPWKHTVAYNANGGWGAPSSQTKTYTYAMNISSTVPQREGYTFTGWATGSNGSGTWYQPGDNYSSDKNGGTVTLYAQWRVNSYSNSIGYWAGGFNNGEGNNGNKSMFNLGSTSFSANYGSSYTMNSGKATRIPKGFYLNNNFGTSSISGAWGTYPIGRSVTQKASNMWFEYYYYPTSYSITYNLGGGTNGSNPSTYNILYGVKLNAPRRAGYTFEGWKDASTGQIITGINEGANASFSSASDMYSKLESRRIGNITLTAQWKVINPELVTKKSVYYQNENIPISKLIIDNAKATDVVEGNITSKIKVTQILYPDGSVVNNPTNFDTSKIGMAQITYKVESERGGSATKVNTVEIIPIIPSGTPTVNEDATIYSRYISGDRLSDGSSSRASLEDGSIWRSDGSYSSKLDESLSRNGDNYIGSYNLR